MRPLACIVVLLGGCAGGAGPPVDGGADAAATQPMIALFTRSAPDAAWSPTTRAFWGDEVDVRVTGLPPGGAVTLVARSGGYGSSTPFHADAAGAIDVATTPPDPGSAYEGADVDGPLWSMAYTGSGAQVEDYAVAFHVAAAGATLASAVLDRSWLPDGATVTPVSDHGLVGVFVRPAGAGPFPALITFGGSEGGLGTGQLLAEYYAQLGYAALGLAYFGAPGVPTDLEKIPLEYFGAAIDWLKARPDVDGARLGVMGGSRGGELALLLGATYPELAVVVATSPSGLVWPASVAGAAQAAWTLGGVDVPYVPQTSFRTTTSTDPDGHTLYADAPAFLDDVQAASPSALAAATIAVERIQGSVLMLAGMDDQLWAGCTLSGYAVDRLKSSGHWQAHGDDFRCYADAGHALVQPGLPTVGANEAYLGDTWLNLGGTPAGIAHANRDADTAIRAFLRQHL